METKKVDEGDGKKRRKIHGVGANGTRSSTLIEAEVIIECEAKAILCR